MSDLSVYDFQGIYMIRQGSINSSTDPNDPRRLVNVDNQIYIEPLTGGDPQQMYFSVMSPQGPLGNPFPLIFDQENGFMSYTTADYEGTGKSMTVQISLYMDPKERYKAVYGLMIYGDPENVGVWGGDAGG